MVDIPLSWLVAGLVLAIAVSAFFSISETAMMAVNRYKLKHLVAQRKSSALRVDALLRRTERLLGGILIANTFSIAAATTIAGIIAVRLFGEGKIIIIVSPLVVSLLLIVFAEITPKVIGATHADRVALALSLPLKFSLYVLDPFAWFVNLFARPLLFVLGFRRGQSAEAQKLSPEEIRTLVLESSSFMPKKHVAILLNLFDLGALTVQDVMVPRPRIESLVLEEPLEDLVRKISTAYHMRLPVFRDHEGELLGVLHLRKALGLLAGGLDKRAIEELVAEPYFVPATTPALAQLQYLQERKEHIALVVDEYGELMGLVTVEDIIEEIIGKFTTSLPSVAPLLSWDEDGAALADGAMPVREVNRALGLELPTGGPKTLNGLILEHLQDIPEADVAVKIAGVPMEIVHTHGRAVKAVRLFRPAAPARAAEGELR